MIFLCFIHSSLMKKSKFIDGFRIPLNDNSVVASFLGPPCMLVPDRNLYIIIRHQKYGIYLVLTADQLFVKSWSNIHYVQLYTFMGSVVISQNWESVLHIWLLHGGLSSTLLSLLSIKRHHCLWFYTMMQLCSYCINTSYALAQFSYSIVFAYVFLSCYHTYFIKTIVQ